MRGWMTRGGARGRSARELQHLFDVSSHAVNTRSDAATSSGELGWVPQLDMVP